MYRLAFSLGGTFDFVVEVEGYTDRSLFDRQVLVDLMGIPERLDWKACMLSEEEDKVDAQAFKSAFAPFTPS